MELVDDLALRPDHIADLVGRYLKGQDFRGVLAHIVPRRSQSSVHHLQHFQASVFRLLERAGQHLRRDAVYLGVQLQGGYIFFGACHFEIHVAVGVFRAEDVGERHILVVFVDETHGDTSHGHDDGHACVHEREARSADRRH